MNRKVAIIGAGFSSLSAATSLASKGFEPFVLEKNESAGGRAQKLVANGFIFDMGPSWYWMPDVFEKYFNRFDKSAADYYELVRLNPSYKVFFDHDEILDIPADLDEYKNIISSLQKGAAGALEKFLDQAAYKYKVGINDLVYKPGRSIREFLDPKLLYDIVRMDVLMSFDRHIRKFFHDPRILMLMEFPVLFLGAIAKKTPALYSLMNYADIELGTWYPMGGMAKVVEGMVSLAMVKGVKFHFNETVRKIQIDGKKATHLITDNNEYEAELIVEGADYYHVEQQFLEPNYRSYSKSYWERRTMAPSALLYYVGTRQKLDGIIHHNLFFDADFERHSHEIYTSREWPSNPLFYVSAASKTDDSIAPAGMENLVILIPVSAGLEDNENIREHYFDLVIDRMERKTGSEIRKHILYKKSFAYRDFISAFNAYKGNAYGLANTLRQTALFKPSLKSKKIRNLYFTGQLTVPGPGVPPTLISGQIVADEIIKDIGN